MRDENNASLEHGGNRGVNAFKHSYSRVCFMIIDIYYNFYLLLHFPPRQQLYLKKSLIKEQWKFESNQGVFKYFSFLQFFGNLKWI